MSRSLLGPAIPFVDAPSSSQINLRPPFCALVRSMGGLDRGPLRHNVCTLTLSCDALWASGAQDRASRASNHSIDAAVSKYRIDASPQHTTPQISCHALPADSIDAKPRPNPSINQSQIDASTQAGRDDRTRAWCCVVADDEQATSSSDSGTTTLRPCQANTQGLVNPVA